IECRKGQGANSNEHQVVFTFANPLTNVTGASVASLTGGTASKTGSMIGPDAHEYIVNFTASDVQRLTVTLTGISDTVGNITPTLSVDMGMLVGDVNGSTVVTTGDTNLCKAQALQPVMSNNFRTDINASGAITTGDVNLIKQNALHQLP